MKRRFSRNIDPLLLPSRCDQKRGGFQICDKPSRSDDDIAKKKEALFSTEERGVQMLKTSRKTFQVHVVSFSTTRHEFAKKMALIFPSRLRALPDLNMI